MDPVLRSLPYEAGLSASCSAIALDWMSSCLHNIIQLRQLNNVFVVVVFEEWFRF